MVELVFVSSSFSSLRNVFVIMGPTSFGFVGFGVTITVSCGCGDSKNQFVVF